MPQSLNGYWYTSVSYTHLDVYKRQDGTVSDDRGGDDGGEVRGVLGAAVSRSILLMIICYPPKKFSTDDQLSIDILFQPEMPKS